MDPWGALRLSNRSSIWTRAFAEGFVIVVSVLVALALDAWWTDRGNRKREAVITADLIGEFEANRNELASDILGNQQLLAATGEIISLGATGLMSLPADSVRRLAGRAVSMRTFDPSGAVLRSIVSAGEFSLISDPSLRAKLAAWEDGLDELKREQDLASEWHNTMLIPRIWNSPSADPVTDDVVAALGLFEPHGIKHRNALGEARALLQIADSVLAGLRAGRR